MSFCDIVEKINIIGWVVIDGYVCFFYINFVNKFIIYVIVINVCC